MNPLYQMYNPQPVNPFAAFQQAMANPPAFVMQKFPDIPQEIANDPAQILGYLQRTRGIPDQRIQQMRQMFGIR